MDNVIIKNQSSEKGKWLFEVAVNGSNHKVSLDREYYLQLTNEKIPAGQLVQRAFIFLLARELKEQILEEFDLRQIKEYFPEFEKEIKL